MNTVLARECGIVKYGRHANNMGPCAPTTRTIMDLKKEKKKKTEAGLHCLITPSLRVLVTNGRDQLQGTLRGSWKTHFYFPLIGSQLSHLCPSLPTRTI